MPDYPYPRSTAPCALGLLSDFGLNLDDVAKEAQVPPSLVSVALQSAYMARCPLIILIKVHTAAEILLRQKGWRGDARMLWRDFYTMLGSAGSG